MDMLKDLNSRLPAAPAREGGARLEPLAKLLLGRAEAADLPPLADLGLALTALAAGRRRRACLPVATQPSELCLERRGEDVLVSLYTTTSQPEVLVRERKVSLRALFAAVLASETDEPARRRRVTAALSDRLESAEIATLEPDDELVIRGGASEPPKRSAALTFGYEIRLRGSTRGPQRGVRADVHALLFEGTLAAFVHGRRVVLARGPIMLAVLRLLAAARTVAESQRTRPIPHVRVRHGSFGVSFRAAPGGKLSLTLEGERGEVVTAAALDAEEALGPITRLGAELVRELIAFDRSQTRNLRVRAIREDIRVLRRLGKAPPDRSSFTSEDGERFRPQVRSATSPSTDSMRPAPTTLRFGERWRLALDGLDARSTFFAGDRLVVASSKHLVAIGRDDGSVLWAREAEGGSAHMAGRTLVRISARGEVELLRVEDGEPFATARLSPRTHARRGVHAVELRDAPPIAVVEEGPTKLAGLDLRTGELVYRFAAREGRPFLVALRGRVLVVGAEDAVHGLDAVTGEVLWCHASPTRALDALALVEDRVYVTSGGTELLALDTYSGRVTASRVLGARIRSKLHALEDGVAVALDGASGPELAVFDASLDERFRTRDPGLSSQGTVLAFDGRIVVNAAARATVAIDARTGGTLWSTELTGPADDAPRLLEPIVRAGALFVPSAEVGVLRPTDGARIAQGFPCDLVPDRLLVDERTWVYVAEESGHLAAYAPVAHLTLIRGGGGSRG